MPASKSPNPKSPIAFPEPGFNAISSWLSVIGGGGSSTSGFSSSLSSSGGGGRSSGGGGGGASLASLVATCFVSMFICPRMCIIGRTKKISAVNKSPSIRFAKGFPSWLDDW
ncbi:MAG: hypothetical protein CBC31_006220 [Verrucomicrobia bacterium TMED71]|nr:MAG: hypothetical protein CBC31_006220 [Verrucomicrobia bacterium TMED71]